MNILELYAGSRSIGKAAEGFGHKVFSVDWEPYDGINLVIDIADLKAEDVPFIPDMVWLSPDCTTYSITAISTHRNGTNPKTEYAAKCDMVNKHVLQLIDHWLKIKPDMKFFIENPRGMMRKMPFMIGIPKATVWYCRYGDDRAKPTDIFSNHIYSFFCQDGWVPRAECFNGNKKCHHEAAPRGSRTGTQGKKGHYERSRIPHQLCLEIIKSCQG